MSHALTRVRPGRVLPGARVAVVSPASPLDAGEFERGIAGLRTLGFEPVWEPSALARDGYVAGTPALRAEAFLRAWSDPSVVALVAARGGYGSAEILPWLDPARLRATPKVFIGYSDTTAILSWLTTGCGLTALHGPMLERRLAAPGQGVDAASLLAALDGRERWSLQPDGLTVLQPGEASGVLLGGTLTMLCASLGTPYAFAPPDGTVLFLEDVNERPYRIDRMLTQLRQAGILDRCAALVFGAMRGCDEAGGPTATEAIRRATSGFAGPILAGMPSGHVDGAVWTLPFGVRARVSTGTPALVIEEQAVE